MNEAKQIHAYTLRHGVERIQPLLLRLLSLPDDPDLLYASSLLHSHPSPPSTLLYNRLLHALSLSPSPSPARSLSLFSRMRRRGLLPNPLSFTLLFSSLASSAAAAAGAGDGGGRGALHALLLKSGVPRDAFVATALIDLYAKSGLLAPARRLFDETPRRDVAVWNSMIAGYARGGDLARAGELFDAMPERNVVSWTSLVSGYARSGRCEEAVRVFLRMWGEGGEARPNEVTLASVLPACASLGAMGLGERIERYARENGLVGNVFVSNALVEMYAKCGSIERARRVFDEMGERRNLCSWNSMIMGLAVHGRCRQALELFHEMLAVGIAPDDITFVGVLLACTHGGLVDQGKHFFYSMEREFSLTPKIEHYGCMVDLLGRAGLLKEAYTLIKSMPMEPDSVIWGALLGACSFHGEVEIAEIAASFLFKLEPWNTGNQVILSNIYASTGKWSSVAKVWKMMKDKQHKKSAGYSFIELEGSIHKFLVEDTSHPRFEEIYEALDEITMTMKLLGYVPNLDLQMES
ncbi:pentatricopeptide repeat-containing protein At5g08510 [Ananas comosus]|uniref:Pentatricopeptide repeat-containing protein At5g08510 n=1 Tax=Ananas comosus TaxID=4615 RepID=A0A6P5GX62_ANACO|nr:pentatricopeptide repeat-containing protein At5g08510 [Ananas comosus]